MRRRIARGELAPGAPVRQQLLAAQLGVSRVPVREALKTLQAEGQVAYRPHRGYYITELDIDDLAEIFRIRGLLETEALRETVPWLTGTDLMRMRSALAQMDQADARGDYLAMTTANRSFHAPLFETPNLPRLRHFIRLLWDASDPYRTMTRFYLDPQHREQAGLEHRELLAAAEVRDVERVSALAELHRQHAVEGLRAMLGAALAKPAAEGTKVDRIQYPS